MPFGAGCLLLSIAMNLLDGEGRAALKADEFEGEPHRRWIFIFDGNILVAS